MNILEKAKILSNSGEYDSCGPKACEVKVNSGLGGIYHAKAEHKTCRLFKTLMNNSCKFDCKYCANASGSCKRKKAEYKPDELAKIFMHLHKTLAVEGLFLSSGIAKDPDSVTENMLAAVYKLRFEYNGYTDFRYVIVEIDKHQGEIPIYGSEANINNSRYDTTKPVSIKQQTPVGGCGILYRKGW